MTICSEISRWGTDGLTDVWTPTTLDALGKNEDYLEQVLATSVPLLGIESRRTGVHGPFQVIRQLPLTLSGIFPYVESKTPCALLLA